MKLQPEYEPKKNPYKQKKSSTKSMKTEKNAPKKKMKPKVKLVLYIFAAFAVLFAMGYQNSLITESCNKKEKLKKEVSAIEKENEQLKVNIEKTAPRSRPSISLAAVRWYTTSGQDHPPAAKSPRPK